MTERKPPGMSFETWVDDQITRSIARGDFEHLPGAGKPLPGLHRDETAYDWALAKARREGVDTAAMLPPGLALRRERDGLPERVERLTTEAEVRALAEDYNVRVEAFWRRPQESRWSPLPGLADVESLVAWWRDNRPEPAHPTRVVPPPAPPRRRFAWLRRGSENPRSLVANSASARPAPGTSRTCREEIDMTEVPGTDRDEARKRLLEETPLAPEDVEGAESDGNEGTTGDQVKPAPAGSDS